MILLLDEIEGSEEDIVRVLIINFVLTDIEWFLSGIVQSRLIKASNIMTVLIGEKFASFSV